MLDLHARDRYGEKEVQTAHMSRAILKFVSQITVWKRDGLLHVRDTVPSPAAIAKIPFKSSSNSGSLWPA